MKNILFRLVLLVLLGSFCDQLFCQQKITLFGKIQDISTNEGLEFTTVYRPETKYYAESDKNGFYKIEMP